jgi:hypothetical protein
VSDETAALLRNALSTTAIAALFPLVELNLPQLVPASTLLNLSRKQLVDILSKISRERSIAEGSCAGLREQVLEVVLEYIGRRWRRAEETEDVVDLVARKLTEIEFEVGPLGPELC